MTDWCSWATTMVRAPRSVQGLYPSTGGPGIILKTHMPAFLLSLDHEWWISPNKRLVGQHGGFLCLEGFSGAAISPNSSFFFFKVPSLEPQTMLMKRNHVGGRQHMLNKFQVNLFCWSVFQPAYPHWWHGMASHQRSCRVWFFFFFVDLHVNSQRGYIWFPLWYDTSW